MSCDRVTRARSADRVRVEDKYEFCLSGGDAAIGRSTEAAVFHLQQLGLWKRAAHLTVGKPQVVTRVVNGKQTSIKVKLDDLINGGDTSQNIPLKPGDILFVPQSRF